MVFLFINTNETDALLGSVCHSCDRLCGSDIACRDLYTQAAQFGRHFCCARTYQQAAAILSQILSQSRYPGKDGSNQTNTTLTLGNVLAHKHVARQLETTEDADDSVVLGFDPNTTQEGSEHVSKVKVTTEGFIIQHSGAYYTYSSLQFSSNTACTENNLTTWGHEVRRLSISGSYSQVLVKSRHTCFSLKDNQTAFSGGVFYLLVDDVIQLHITHKDTVKFLHTSSYMGVYKLST
ncbi:uncharacterized protein LOC131943492 [Physella acuta]|uniref:uncharacterized protein LOC131943492 n=1 Tax=Physella acuta TaxID=109671 RepID=UPI0027DB7CB5|nr:uncharacterized protein LOC131943492 [Physella acuta]